MRTRLGALLVGLGLSAGLAEGQPAPAAATFERLKSLVGEWEAMGPDSERVRVIYELVSGGKAVMERVVAAEHGASGMLSIFHLDGERIGMSHFCSAGNQPRFHSVTLGDTVRFELVRQSLVDQAEGHIHEVEFRFGGDGRLETEWVWFDQGRRGHTLVRRQVRLR